MSEGTETGGGAATEGAGDAGQGGAAGGGQGGAAAIDMKAVAAAIPQDVREALQLDRYESPEAWARGHLETKKAASSRLAVPAADAGPEAWDPIYSALGRPEKPDAYDFGTKAEEESAMLKAFRPVAHQLGMNPSTAKGVVEFYNGLQQAEVARDTATLETLKREKGGDYPAMEQSAIAAFKAMGLEADFPEVLARMTNSGALIKGFATIAEKIGEHQRVDPSDGPDAATGVNDSQAEGELTKLQANAEWRKKIIEKDPVAVAQRTRLITQAQRHAQRNGVG